MDEDEKLRYEAIVRRLSRHADKLRALAEKNRGINSWAGDETENETDEDPAGKTALGAVLRPPQAES